MRANLHTIPGMSILLSLGTVYEIGRAVMPTFAESLFGEVDRDTVDARLRSFSRGVVKRTRMRLQVEGREEVPTDQTLIYMSNHQSHMDIPVLYATMPSKTLRMVAKTELFHIPFWTRALRSADFIEINRGSRTEAVASLKSAQAKLQSGVCVWIAPEGSRSRTGRLGPLKKGGFHMAKNTGTPIVPIAITGTRDVLPPGSIHTTPDRSVRVVFGAPISVEKYTIPELMEEVASFLRTHIGS